MRACVFGAGLVAVAALVATPAAAIKKVAYPEIKVEVAAVYKPDPAFEAMHKAFADAAAKKDAAAMFTLVGPTFLWTAQNEPTIEFDLGRNALHNFKVVFGFRELGKDVDGPVENGPYWEALQAFAADGTFYAANDSGNLVCGPIGASVVDEQAFEQARKAIAGPDDEADWYFTLAETSVAKAPGDTGPPIAKVGTVALPVLSVYPEASADKPSTAPTHLEVLLPSGKSGWIPAASARALVSERLCFAKTPDGSWKIAAYDQAE